MVRDAIREIPDFPPDLALELEHLILSHHGSREHGSPVVPMTVEALHPRRHRRSRRDDPSGPPAHRGRRLRGRVHDVPPPPGARAVQAAAVVTAAAPDAAATRRRAWIAWAAVCLIWGTTYLAIKVALETIPPFLMGGVRYIASGDHPWPSVLKLRGHALPRPRGLGPARDPRLLHAACSATAASSGASSTCRAVSRRCSSARRPFWMVSVDAMFTGGQQMHARQWIGLAIGFCGIVLLVWPDITGGGASGHGVRARRRSRFRSRAPAGRSDRPTRGGTSCRATCSARRRCRCSLAA